MNSIPSDSERKLFAVIGRDVSQSKSPAVHNAAFQALNLPYRFVAISTEDPERTVNIARNADYGGLAVTMPYKESVISLMTEIDSSAAEVGAVNTIVFHGDRIVGANTDVIGIRQAFAEAGIGLTGKHVAVLGAGGAARAAVAAVKADGAAAVTVFARRKKRAETIAEDAKLVSTMTMQAVNFKSDRARTILAEAQIVIQTTPVGSIVSPTKTPLPVGWIPEGVDLLDVVYAPLPTPLMQAVQESGGRVVGGDRMFLHQAAAQFAMWTGLEAPFDIMAGVFRESGS